MMRIGLALIWAAAVWGQSRFEMSVRMSMRTEVDGKETVKPEETLATQRISVRGELVRVDDGANYAIRDLGKGSVVIARESDKSYVRTTASGVAEAMVGIGKDVEGVLMRNKPQLEMMSAPPMVEPPYSWNGQKTESTSCRFRMVMQAPGQKMAPAPVTTMHVYSVPGSGDLVNAITAWEGLGVTGGSGIAIAFGALEDCQPKGRMVVRSLILSDIEMTTPVRMRMRSEIVMDVKLLAGEPGPEEFTVPAGWAEGPAESVVQRAREFLRLPAAIQ
jgi:hypothetical protein